MKKECCKNLTGGKCLVIVCTIVGIVAFITGLVLLIKKLTNRCCHIDCIYEDDVCDCNDDFCDCDDFCDDDFEDNDSNK